MPMIDVYSAPDTFADKHALAQDLANAVMRWEQVPPIALFSKNTAAFAASPWRNLKKRRRACGSFLHGELESRMRDNRPSGLPV